MNDTNTENAPSGVHQALKAGMQLASPSSLGSSQYSHHKEVVISDLSAAELVRAKRHDSGPDNPSGTINTHRPESFAYVFDQYREERTQVFANAEKREIISVFDYVADKNESRGWSQFRALIAFGLSRKLKEWKQCLEWQSQSDFANFLEDHLEDVIDPSGQDLLSLATDLEATNEGHFKGKLNLDNGSVQLAYQDDVQTTVEVPKKLTLGIPLFEHGDPFKLNCRLRFNVTAGGVRFKILFTNLTDALEAEFERIVQELEEKMGHTIIRGELASHA